MNKILARRKSLMRLLGACGGRVPSGAEFAEFVAKIRHLLPALPPDSVRWSLEPYVGRELPANAISRLAWSLAGRCVELKNNPVYETDWKIKSGWCLAVIEEVRPARRRPGKKFALSIRLKALSGVAAGLTLIANWSSGMVHHVARAIGFSRPTGRFPCEDAVELTGLRLWVYCDAALARDDGPRFHYVHGTSTTWNRSIIKKRQRETFACPRKYPLTTPCRNCPAGRDECPAACRPRSLQEILCPVCAGRHTVDLALVDKRCLTCRKADRQFVSPHRTVT